MCMSNILSSLIIMIYDIIGLIKPSWVLCEKQHASPGFLLKHNEIVKRKRKTVRVLAIKLLMGLKVTFNFTYTSYVEANS